MMRRAALALHRLERGLHPIPAAEDSIAAGRPGPRRPESEMPLMNVLVTLIVIGVLLWLVNTYLPMDAKIKKILNIVVVIAVVLWLLNAFGLLGSLQSFKVGKG
jgi:hypothetical protein